MANMALNKVPMPEQEPNVRARNFDEVTLGYTEEMAVEEAQRCLNCKNKPCVEGCPEHPIGNCGTPLAEQNTWVSRARHRSGCHWRGGKGSAVHQPHDLTNQAEAFGGGAAAESGNKG